MLCYKWILLCLLNYETSIIEIYIKLSSLIHTQLLIISKFYNNLGKLEIESILVRSCIDDGPELFTTTAFESSQSSMFAIDVNIWDNCPNQNLWNLHNGR